MWPGDDAGLCRAGVLRLNGVATQTSLVSQGIAAFVEQHSTLLGDLTVEQAFKFAAALQLPYNWSASRKRDRQELIIQTLGLERVRTHAIRSLSGGEQRRVSIGTDALLGTAQLYFLDEPTTGLSSTGATDLMKFLHQLTRVLNLSVVIALHQPSAEVFRDYLDRVVLISGEGKLVCNTAPARISQVVSSSEAANCLKSSKIESTNPADLMMDLLANKHGANMLTGLGQDTAVNDDSGEAEAKTDIEELQRNVTTNTPFIVQVSRAQQPYVCLRVV